MSRREATAGTQGIRPVGEQLDVREMSAERDEVPRAVDIRERLEHSDHADREQCRDREECSRPSQRTQVTFETGQDPEAEGASDHRTDRPAAASVDQLVYNP